MSRFAIFSEVKLSDGGQPRPIHILRTGTFADSEGKEHTFTKDDLQSIVDNYSQRPNPPITERHDFGRAVGRTTALFLDDSGESLYSMPRWNGVGRSLIEEGVYDGYSCELDPADGGGFIKIGGSLTNYPAVKGLSPVTLEAPEPAMAPTPTPTDMCIAACQTCEAACLVAAQDCLSKGLTAPAQSLLACAAACSQCEEALERGDTGCCMTCAWACECCISTCAPYATDLASSLAACNTCCACCRALVPQSYYAKEPTMSEPQDTPTPNVDATALLSQALGGEHFTETMRKEFASGLTKWMEQQTALAVEQAQVAVQRNIAEFHAQQAVLQFAQDVTTPSLRFQHALPVETDKLSRFLSGLSADQRKEAQSIFDHIRTAGLISFEEIGSQGEGQEQGDPISAYEDALSAELRVNSVRSVALGNLQRKHPEIVRAYNEARSKNGRH